MSGVLYSSKQWLLKIRTFLKGNLQKYEILYLVDSKVYIYQYVVNKWTLPRKSGGIA